MREVLVTNTNDRDAFGFKDSISPCIIVLLVIVDRAIELNCELMFHAIEVNDEATEGLLPTKS